MVWAQARELSGSALDWAAAQSLGYVDVQVTGFDEPGEAEECFFRPAKLDARGREVCGSGMRWNPSGNWAQCGDIVQHLVAQGCAVSSDPQETDPQYKFCVAPPLRARSPHHYYGATLPEAGLRCLAAVRLGVWIAVPQALLPINQKQAVGDKPAASASREREHG